MSTSPATGIATGDEHARLHQLAAAGRQRLHSLITGLLTAPDVLDRPLLGDFAAFLDHDAWMAVDATERLRSHPPAPDDQHPSAGVTPQRTVA